MLVLEVGLLLDKPLEYYQEILRLAGATNEFNCETHDFYWTNKSTEELESLTENQIKNSCVRFRMCKGFAGEKLEKKKWTDGEFSNFKLFDKTSEGRIKIKISKLKKYNRQFVKNGWQLVFDTLKTDYQYSIGDMKSRIQLQEIQDLGLVLYYDNPDYYHLSEDEQRIALIRELNGYGFDFAEDMLGIDKLRTFVHQKQMFSKNQNG